MKRLVVSLVSLSLVWGPCALAQEVSSATKSDYPPNFPPAGYRPLPPHFQPRRVIAANPEKVDVAPPQLPSYQQPAIPAEGYLWVPGYWAWRKSVPDYFWVPGTWVKPPQAGLLWTPPYWSRVDGGYAFRAGYWATEVGFYGGINYGFGYTAGGYQGGRWEHGTFSYNRVANNLGDVELSGVYDQAAQADSSASRFSFNGGRRGTIAKPSKHEETLAGERHVEATSEQQKHFELAAMDRSLYAKLNNGEPAVAATQHANVFTGAGVTQSSRSSNQPAQLSDGVPTSTGAGPIRAPDIPDRTERPGLK